MRLLETISHFLSGRKPVIALLGMIMMLAADKAYSQNKTYYIDNILGNDNNQGTNRQSAWKTLDKISSILFQPGDQILLKRNQVFEGALLLHGSGNKSNPVKLGSFGEGQRPLINADHHEFAIKMMDEQYWEIAGIAAAGSKNAGIYIGCTKDGLSLNDIRIINCYVHDIGDTAKIDWDYSKSTGGIIVVNGSFTNDGKPVFYNSVFNNVLVEGCIVRYNNRWTCISISSGKNEGKGGNGNAIKDCIVEYSAADGIRMNGVRNSFIEYCILYRNGSWPKIGGRNLGGLGAWFFDAENCTIQFCEASYTGANTSDGGAFDIDYWQKNSTVQFCYGHHCAGYGVSVFGADANFPTENSTVRYNVFCNNGMDTAFAYEGDFYVFTWNGGQLNGVDIHDNISYWDPAGHAPSLKHEAAYTGNNPNRFTNNIINSKIDWLVYSRNDTLKRDSNYYWSNAAKPLWSDAGGNSYSLNEWQKQGGQESNSRYAKYAKRLPSWYQYELPKQLKGNKTAIVGSKAPGFSVKAINRQSVNLDQYKNDLVLLCFINLQSALTADTAQRSLSQLVFLKSMQRQYEEKGLKMIWVDESGNTGLPNVKEEILINFAKDLEIEDIPVINDNKALNLASKYAVSFSPASFLIQSGTILNRWQRLALPAQLAFAIEDALNK